MLGRDVSWPVGLLDIASQAGVPIVPYWIEFDLERGTRVLAIGEPLDPAGEDTLQALADLLDEQIRRTPSAWMLWSEWRHWMDAGTDTVPPT
jgi:lauroyl/myristoyl acyltransferase